MSLTFCSKAIWVWQDNSTQADLLMQLVIQAHATAGKHGTCQLAKAANTLNLP